jgi:hypothetical protein
LCKRLVEWPKAAFAPGVGTRQGRDRQAFELIPVSPAARRRRRGEISRRARRQGGAKAACPASIAGRPTYGALPRHLDAAARLRVAGADVGRVNRADGERRAGMPEAYVHRRTAVGGAAGRLARVAMPTAAAARRRHDDGRRRAAAGAVALEEGARLGRHARRRGQGARRAAALRVERRGRAGA